MTLPPPSTMPAGWYPDPETPESTRWWDGHQWGIRGEPPTPVEPRDNLAVTAFSFSIVGHIFAFTGLIGILAGLTAVIIGTVGLTRRRTSRALFIVATTLGATALVAAIIISITR